LIPLTPRIRSTRDASKAIDEPSPDEEAAIPASAAITTNATNTRLFMVLQRP
jgi:hypothetical protein